jgi:hypothetical protein
MARIRMVMTLSQPHGPRTQRKHARVGAAVTLVAMTLVIGLSARSQAPNREPLTLRMLLDSVRAAHPLIGAADARIRAARGARATAGTLGNPVLGYEVDNTPFPGRRAIAGLDREAMTTATLPLEPLFQRGPKVARANADIRAAEADRHRHPAASRARREPIVLPCRPRPGHARHVA